jgi:hypothetical protein
MSWIGSCQSLFTKCEIFLVWLAIIDGSFKRLQDCKINHQAVEEGQQVHMECFFDETFQTFVTP